MELHRKKSMIKTRQSEFKVHKEPLMTTKGIFHALVSGARYVHKVATSEKTKSALTRLGEGATRFAEAQREQPRRKATKKRSRR